MATRSLWPEGVEVHQDNLTFERDARIADHIQSLIDESSMGVTSGFGVTVNGGDNTKIDVAAGDGYAPDGEYVELDPGQSAVALASGVLGTVNLVCAVYTETESDPRPHETGTTSPYTKATRSVRIRVYTVAQYNALASSDDNLANDARDRCLILARVTGTGGALTAGSIVGPTSFSTINYATAPVNITGVSITGVSSNTNEGTGTLVFTLVGTTLTWTPPGGAAGAAVNVGAGGSFTISGGGGSPPTITVDVIAGSLPAGNQSDSIVITNLYNQTVARFTADDGLHRSMLGTGTPSPTNPHGLRMEDIGGSEINELNAHQDIQHSNGIWRGSSASGLVVSIDDGAIPHSLDIAVPGPGDTYYVEGRRLDSILNTNIGFGSAPANAILYEVVVDHTGFVTVSARASWQNPSNINPGVSRRIEIIDMSDTTGAGAKTLAYTSVGTTLSWDGGPTVNVSGLGHFRLVSANDLDTIDVFVVSLPPGNASDTITVNALASTETYLRLAMVCWTGSGTGYLGYTPNRGVIATNLLDKRVYGNLSDYEVQDEAIAQIVTADGYAPTIYRTKATERMTNELRASGVVIGLDRTEANSLSVVAGAGLTINVAGGVAYVFGIRFEHAQETGVVVLNNTTNWIYLDATGTVRVTNTLTFSQIVGDSTINNPGRGIMLAKVVTVGGAITEVVDYRRNIARLDNIVGSITVSGQTNGRNRAQFFSIRAALDYAALHNVVDIKVTGSLTETLPAPISLTTKLRILVDPGVIVTFAGAAASVFSIGSGGALEWWGGGATVSGSESTFIAYGGSASSWVIFRDVDIVLGPDCALFTNTTSTVHDQGVRFEGCGIDNNSSSQDTVWFNDGWDGLFLFRDCEINNGTQGLIRDALGGSDYINQLTIIDCKIDSGAGTWHFYLSTNAIPADWLIQGNIFINAGAGALQFRSSSERCSFIDNEWDCDGNYGLLFNPAGSGNGAHSNLLFQGNTMRGQVLNPIYFFGGALAKFTSLRIEDNVFGPLPSAVDTLLFKPDGTSDLDGIHICGNEIGEGRIQIGDASAAAPPTIRNIVIDGNTISASEGSGGGAISLDNTAERFSIINNHVVYSGDDSGIYVSANSSDGTIANNTIRTASGSGLHGIHARSDYTTISGNDIAQTVDSSALVRSGIHAEGDHTTIEGNTIRTDSDTSMHNGIDSSGAYCTIGDNTVEFTDTAGGTNGCGILVEGSDVTVAGNTVLAAAATSVVSMTATQNRVAITGNKFSATAATPDVDAQGARMAFLGNVVATSTTTGTATIGDGGGTSKGDSTMNVCTVTLS